MHRFISAASLLFPLLVLLLLGEAWGRGRRRAWKEYGRRRRFVAYNLGTEAWPCPTGSDFIKDVNLNSVSKTYNSVTKSFDMNLFMVNSQPASVHDLQTGYERGLSYGLPSQSDTARSYYVKTSSSGSWQELDEASAKRVPSAYGMLLYHSKIASMYAEGVFKKLPNTEYDDDPDSDNRYQTRNNWGLRGDVEFRMWWPLSDHTDDSKCYAMATYQEDIEEPAKDFKSGDYKGNSVDGIHKVEMRMVKFTVCRGSECQTKRLVLDCWLETDDEPKTWVQCDDYADKAAVAGILSRN